MAISSFLSFKATSRYTIIDTLRALAICAVVIFHYSASRFPNGWIGVDLFFIISGFLVSSNFFSRVSQISQYNYFPFLIHFIHSRFLRIYVPFIFFIPLTLLIAFLTLDWSAKTNNYLYLSIANLLLSSPFALLRNKSYFEQSSIDLTYHLWSISSELFCYILLPLIFYFSYLLARYFKKSPKAFVLTFGFFCSILLYLFLGDTYYNLGGYLFFSWLG